MRSARTQVARLKAFSTSAWNRNYLPSTICRFYRNGQAKASSESIQRALGKSSGVATCRFSASGTSHRPRLPDIDHGQTRRPQPLSHRCLTSRHDVQIDRVPFLTSWWLCRVCFLLRRVCPWFHRRVCFLHPRVFPLHRRVCFLHRRVCP